MDRIATICASYCSEVEKYLSIARPGTFPDPDMLVRATCNHLIFQLHLWVLLASWATVINQAPKHFHTHKGQFDLMDTDIECTKSSCMSVPCFLLNCGVVAGGGQHTVPGRQR
jgi:hypothetical protein